MLSLQDDENDKEFVLWNCPVLFVTQWCKNFIQIYDAFQNHQGAKFDVFTAPIKYLLAETYFLNIFNEYKYKVEASNSRK